MKLTRIVTLLAASAVLASCAYVPINQGTERRVSPDYKATGAIQDARAYIYGDRTLLEFDSAPAFVSIRDENSAVVGYEREGRYYRLPRILGNFTVWVNGRSVTFSPVVTTRVFSAVVPPAAVAPAPAEKKPEAVKLETAPKVAPAGNADTEVLDLLDLTEKQLAEIRAQLDAANKNPKATGADLFAVSQRLDEIEARLTTASAAVVQVTFAHSSTAFKPDAREAKVLIASAKAADLVNVRGHTDSRVAGKLDAKIALGRAMAARKFLVDNGVQADKIKVSSMPDGGFIAPNLTKKGKTLNRRVEIEFVNARIAELTTHTAQLAANKAGQ